ncbi:MAG: hypothetical protein EZS28_038882 [Streblomastix strix]|uniref:Uncharacterized protein n=1 Tax=Streblomastix strix TaxID=222440 RepID=A0A5J4U5W4_9EUKA|nr:MAG: hypothetical protein EZS28_038882 [Streblomastix strix]
MQTVPQETEVRIGELIYKEKSDGVGGDKKIHISMETNRERRVHRHWIQLRFKDQNSQQRLEENKMIISFRGTQEEKKAYQQMMKKGLEEGIVIPIQQDQVKW